ncbi:MAG: hypothetical protein KDC00_02025 [Flavobacteriales bacterium]|nr:hypothetical protein [Flavobacteriales bacterium]
MVPFKKYRSLHWTIVLLLIEALWFSLVIFTSVRPLLGEIRLSPDSTNWIVAAKNLMEHGTFHVQTNWPSKSLLPIIEPFTDYPPGYSFYLTLFLLVIHDPVVAATWAHAVSILMCFCGLAFLFRSIGLPLILRIAGYLLFAMLGNFPIIYQYFWTEPLFLGLSFLGGAFALRMGTDPSFWGKVLPAASCFFLASSMKVIGVFNFAWFLVPLLRTPPIRWRMAAGMMIACTAPLVLWFARNKIVHGQMSFSHRIGETHLKDELLVPLRVITHDLIPVFDRPWTGPIMLTILCFILWGPLFLREPTLLKAKAFLGERKRVIHLQLVLVLSAHFFGIWALSLVSHFSALDDRLLSPSIALAIIAGLSGLDRFCDLLDAGGRLFVRSLPFVYMAVGMHITVPKLTLDIPHFTHPPHAELWTTLDSSGIPAGATHYYTDQDFSHQLYSPLPHRILWETSDFNSPDAIRALFEKGTRPFFIFDTTSVEFNVFEQAWRSDHDPLLEARSIGGFMVYHRP